MTKGEKFLWTKVRNKKCKLCPLHKTTDLVCLMGRGPVPNDIMIIGEGPGYRENELRRPFVGKSGQLLRQQLRTVGLDDDKLFWTNVNKCRPPENRTPLASEATACRPYLEQELEIVKPKFILLAGNHALRLIKKSGIMKHRGELFEYNGALVMPTVHPAAVLRNPRYEQVFKADIHRFARIVKGEESDKKTKVYLVQDKKTLEVMVKACMSAKAIAYDLETNGFSEFASDAQIATISVTPQEGVSFVVPVHHPESRWKDPSKLLRIVGNALLYSNARLIAHNAKFDDRWLNQFGVHTHADFDTMLCAHILDENRLKGLKPLSQMLLGVDAWNIDVGGQALETPLNKLAVYNAKDTDYTYRLYQHFRTELSKDSNRRSARLFLKLIMPVSRALTDIERVGIWVDQDRLRQRQIQVNAKLEKLNRQLVKIAGMQLNWNSPKQLAELIFTKLKLPIIETTKTGAASTKESVLLRLTKKHKVAKLLLEYRKWAKWKSTYLDGWAVLMDENGRIHANYKIWGTVTGRLSSGKETGDKGRGLNAQQIPRDTFVRGILGAPPGWRFVEADFSQAELRIAAHYSGDRTMQRYFRMGHDIHLATAVRLTGKPAERIAKEERKKAKGVNFGFLFGMGAPHFVEFVRDNYDLIVTLEEAEEARKVFFEEYSELKPWHERQRRLARKYKQVQSVIGRIRHLPDIESSDKEVRAEAERQAINAPVQGLASDLNLLSMVLLHEKMPKDEARIVASVHDSLLFEIREDRVDYWVKEIRETMENLPLKQKFGATLDVPMKVDISTGTHWGEGEEVGD